ncbi:hypothetical protein [Microbispora sp. NPDC049125]|uniref:hypothetical protein n=1 Tax=Microbispora sp. NPDC049125 TaxID=3154929 RepID=UPI003465A594
MRLRLIISSLAALAATMGAGWEEEPRTIPASSWKTAFTWADPAIVESSGLYASAVHPGVVWTVNDGEGPVRLYAVGPDGKTRGVVTLPQATGVDPEAMGGAVAEDGTSWVYVGDLGANPTPRPDGILVHRFAEPGELGNQEVPSTTYRLVYPDGPHDAETLLVDPNTSHLYVVTKSEKGGDLYSAPLSLSAGRANPLTHVARLPYVISDGLLTAKGAMILRGYGKMWVWDRIGGQVTWTVEIPRQRQGEGVALTADGGALLISTEDALTPVYRLDLPEELRAEPPWLGAHVPVWAWGAGGGAAVVLLLAGLVVVRRRSAA